VTFDANIAGMGVKEIIMFRSLTPLSAIYNASESAFLPCSRFVLGIFPQLKPFASLAFDLGHSPLTPRSGIVYGRVW